LRPGGKARLYRSTIAALSGIGAGLGTLRAHAAVSELSALHHTLGKARNFRSASHCVASLSFATPLDAARRDDGAASRRIAQLPSAASIETRRPA